MQKDDGSHELGKTTRGQGREGRTGTVQRKIIGENCNAKKEVVRGLEKNRAKTMRGRGWKKRATARRKEGGGRATLVIKRDKGGAVKIHRKEATGKSSKVGKCVVKSW